MRHNDKLIKKLEKRIRKLTKERGTARDWLQKTLDLLLIEQAARRVDEPPNPVYPPRPLQGRTRPTKRNKS